MHRADVRRDGGGGGPIRGRAVWCRERQHRGLAEGGSQAVGRGGHEDRAAVVGAYARARPGRSGGHGARRAGPAGGAVAGRLWPSAGQAPGGVEGNKQHLMIAYTVVGEDGKGLFEASPGAASLDKLSGVSLLTRQSSVDALRVLDRSLDRIHKERAKLGALMSRMEKAIDNLSNVALNTKASRGRIEDADFAKESARMTKAQILQQVLMSLEGHSSYSCLMHMVLPVER